MAFERVTGGELFDDIVARKFYSEADASYFSYQLLDAVSYCHRQGIVHRDLKPENLLLSSKARGAQIKVSDFGLALEVKGDSMALFGFCGTPGYISPEVLNNEPYGKPVDVWAVGVIIYILLAGYPPFYDEDDRKLYELTKQGDYRVDSPDWESISVEAKQLISRLLTVNVRQRITAEEAMKSPWIAHRKGIASDIHRSDTIERLKKFNARRKLKAAIITTMIATTGLAHKNDSAAAGVGAVRAKLSEIAQKVPKHPTPKPEHTGAALTTAARRKEIIGLTERLLQAIDAGNYGSYTRMVVPYVTTFDPDASGELVQGVEFHRNQFDHVSRSLKVISTKILNPYVHLLGPEAACIAYTRLTQYFDRDKKEQLQHCEESRIWQKQKNGVWQNVHVHRSIYQPLPPRQVEPQQQPTAN